MMMTLKKRLSFLLNVFFALLASSSSSESGESCLLNGGQYGKCLSATVCERIHQAKISRSMNNCSVEDSVCCPVPEPQSRISEDPDSIVFLQKRSNIQERAAKKWCNYYKDVCVCPNFDLDGMAFAGGENAYPGEFPHMAAIGYGAEDDITWQCGGSLISEDYVLTAAHCLSDESRNPAAWVRLGSVIVQDRNRKKVNGSTQGQTHPVLKRIGHPDYKKPSKYYDVALLKIGSALEADALSTFSYRIHPACLPINDDLPEDVVGSGWGRLGPSEVPAPILQKGILNIYNNSECNKTFELVIKTTAQLRRGIQDSQLCAGRIEGGIDTCQGDSGGPLQVSKWLHCLPTLIGITSFGTICATKGTLGVYTRVISFIDWIEEIVWNDRNICSVDDDHYGECLPLSNCTHIHKLIHKGYRPVHCGYNLNEPIVCCPSTFHDILLPPPAKSSQQGKSRPPGEAAKQWCEKYQSIWKSTTDPKKNLPKDESHYPHLALIGYGELKGIQWHCAGSLISENFVLIAAHCLTHSKCKPAKWVRLGKQTSQPRIESEHRPELEQVHPITEVIVHPEYREPSQINDLALLKIGDPIGADASSTLSALIHPACLQVPEKKVNEITLAGVSTWTIGPNAGYSLTEDNVTAVNTSVCSITSETSTEENEKFSTCTWNCNGLCTIKLEGLLQIRIDQDLNVYEVMGLSSSVQENYSVLKSTRIMPYLSWIEDNVWPST